VTAWCGESSIITSHTGQIIRLHRGDIDLRSHRLVVQDHSTGGAGTEPC